MEPYLDMDADPRDFSGIWHVTTDIGGVAHTGRLLSRRELRARPGVPPPAGLGGGVLDVAPDAVSTVTRPEDALRILRAMQRAALAAHDRIPAWRAAWETMQDSHWSDLLFEAKQVLEGILGWEWGRADAEQDEDARAFREALAEVEACLDEVWGGSWPKDERQARAKAEKMDRRWCRAAAPLGQSRFDLILAVEACAHQLWEAMANLPQMEDDEILQQLTAVGFTTDKGWTRIDPRKIRVLRLAARVDAKPAYEPHEAELRFKPEDLVVLGVESIRGLVKLAEAPSRLRFNRRSRRPLRRRGRASVTSGPAFPEARFVLGGTFDPEAPFAVRGVRFDPQEGIGATGNNANINYMGFVAWMPVEGFLRLNPQRVNFNREKSAPFLREAVARGRSLGPPTLTLRVHLDDRGQPRRLSVGGHEGRGRATVLAEMAGRDALLPVHVLPLGRDPNGHYVELRARHLDPKLLLGMKIEPDALREEGQSAGWAKAVRLDRLTHQGRNYETAP